MNTKVFLVDNPNDFHLPIAQVSAHLFMIVCFENGKHALLSLYKDVKENRPVAKFGLPGGKNDHQNLNETPLEILKRELIEELDFDLDLNDICPGAIIYHRGKQRLTHSFYSLISRNQAAHILENSHGAEHKDEFNHFRVLRIDLPYLIRVLKRNFSKAHKMHLVQILRQLDML